MAEDTRILPGLSAVAGKPVHVGFDGGRLTSDGGILLLAAIEQRLRIAERLAGCLEDPRDPERVWHELADMIRYRTLLIAAGYPDGNDCDALKSDPAFKMAVGRLPESGKDLCSQPRDCEEFRAEVGHDRNKGARRCHDAKNLAYPTLSSTSCWPAPIPGRFLIPMAFSTS